MRDLKEVFSLIRQGCSISDLTNSRFIKDVAYFYTMTTSFLDEGFRKKYSPQQHLAALAKFSKYLDLQSIIKPDLKKKIVEFKNLCSKQTTDPAKRKLRDELFKDILEQINKLTPVS
jgi:hypothetical protein